MFSDIVFFIFLYQRWIYKVDKSRVNEFGISGEMEEEAKNKSGAVAAIDNGAANAPSASPAKTKKDKKRD